MAPAVALNKQVDCPACREKRLHTDQDWEQYHPFKGHGFVKELGWSHPDLEPVPLTIN